MPPRQPSVGSPLSSLAQLSGGPGEGLPHRGARRTQPGNAAEGLGGFAASRGYNEPVATDDSFMQSVTKNKNTRQRQRREQARPGCHRKPRERRLLLVNVLAGERKLRTIPPFVNNSNAWRAPSCGGGGGQVGSDSLGGSNGQWTFWKQSGQISPGHKDVPDL